MAIVKIKDYFGPTATAIPAKDDTTVTIADLAVFLEFDQEDIARTGASPVMIALEALEDEYGAYEKADSGWGVTFSADDVGLCLGWMTFKDGSEIRITGN